MTAQKTEKVIIEGVVAKISRTTGDFKADDGHAIDYDFYEVKILTADTDVNIVRYAPKGSLAVPVKGAEVRLICDARVTRGNVKLTAEYLFPYTFSEVLAAAGLVESVPA